MQCTPSRQMVMSTNLKDATSVQLITFEQIVNTIISLKLSFDSVQASWMDWSWFMPIISLINVRFECSVIPSFAWYVETENGSLQLTP